MILHFFVSQALINTRAIRIKIVISLLVLTPIGFASKFYNGPAAWWFNDYAGGMLYELFWCLVVVLIWPQVSRFKVALWVLGVTSFLEWFQLAHPPFLETIRSTFIGRTLIGTSFSWWDFPYYVVGCFFGWLWIGFLRRSALSDQKDHHHADRK
ncbi:DUF2809 domain-containing protein [bacterium]|nr:DUF2809 domain-containing protein [bacterium]RQV93759.1 MAG: DUF2809 domain-containing protein [bacterium]